MPREDASGKSGELLERQGRIQRELLQLHVLHSRSSEIHSQWRQSAKAHFYKRFQELVDRHTEIADIIFQTQELKNRAALVDWCRRGQAFDISKRVRILSVCIRELCENLDPSGKYNQIMGSFAAWYNREREIQESRKRGSIDDLVNPEYVEEIGAGWQNDVNALQRRLSTLTGELRMLGSANANSTLGQLLVVLQDLVIDMLTELDCIRSIECELVMQEKVWIEEQIMTLSLKVKDVGSSRDTPSKLRGLDD
ncbi:MAG: hypothetical protein L6R40_002433 [Gallowayella cf. fulva]|nr:MAG: hypothetical protein L6R40_002433 [Xanthomendoza cf. fulva]